MLEHFTHLNSLDLSYNDLTRYNSTLFESLTELQYLNLAGNQLTVKKDLLLDIPGLINLDIRSTGQRAISGMNGRNPNLNPHLLLLLDDNPWRCDCNLEWLWELINSQMDGRSWHLEPHEIFDIRCASPTRVEDELLKDLALFELSC